MKMPPLINLYAEFLMNIRQVTIYATLEDEHQSGSDVLIFSDTKTLTVKYEGASATITFPSGVSGTARVEFPVEKRKVISLRLEITEDDKPSHGEGMDVGNDSPWPAGSLSNATQIACRGCQRTLVAQSERTWKDLPREHWAEMMDLWHCHKPNVEKSNGDPATNKGYSAHNKPRLRKGLAFVDTCHVLISYDEVDGIEILSDRVTCQHCHKLLGTTDADFEGIKFYKWSIVLKRNEAAAWEQNAVQNFVCAQLLELIDSQAAKKFLAYAGNLETAVDALLLWSFNPDVKYSASFLRNGQPRRAMKIMYRSVKQPLELLNTDSALEELRLPSEVMEKLRDDLDTSNKILPPGAQLLQDWKVALLDRFESASG